MSKIKIFNYVQYNERVATSGQPEIDEFDLIAQQGSQAVINLAMPNSDGAIANEGSIVTGLGMAYFHIPVPFNEPKIAQLVLFIKIMESLKSANIWVHCVANYRVSAFMYQYQRKVYGASKKEAMSTIFEFWQPDKNWQNIMDLSVENILL